MKFSYCQPTQVLFGRGRIRELGEVAGRYGKRCLLVTVKEFPAVRKQFSDVRNILGQAGIEVAHFDGVVPNPTVDSIAAGAKLARRHKAQVVIGLGGGSSMDSAKAIAVAATHPGSCWDYLFYKKAPTGKTLPVVAVSTTSGTGSHVTQVAVITNTKTRDKSAIYHSNVYPKAAIVDPDLMMTVPSGVTAATGFDVFCHAFESTLHPNHGLMTDIMAWEAIRLVSAWLPKAMADGSDIAAREALAWADTLAGHCIANAGVVLPHGMGMAVGGMYPQIAHGESLAVLYPAFTRFTWQAAIPQFANVARILDPSLSGAKDRRAAEQACKLIDTFIGKVGLNRTLSSYGAPKKEIHALRDQCMVLPDYKGNPRVATKAEMLALLEMVF